MPGAENQDVSWSRLFPEALESSPPSFFLTTEGRRPSFPCRLLPVRCPWLWRLLSGLFHVPVHLQHGEGGRALLVAGICCLYCLLHGILSSDLNGSGDNTRFDCDPCILRSLASSSAAAVKSPLPCSSRRREFSSGGSQNSALGAFTLLQSCHL